MGIRRDRHARSRRQNLRVRRRLLVFSPPSGLAVPNPDRECRRPDFKEFAVTTAEGRVYTLGGSDTSPAVMSYGPLKAALGPYKAWWNFNGNTSVPVYACYFTGANPSTRVYGQGKVGNWAGTFDGATSLSAPANCTDVAAGDFSIEFWMRHDGSAGSSLQSILDKRSQDLSGYHGYHVYFYQGAIGLQMADGSYANFGSSISIPTNTWTHIAITVNRATNGGRIWVNGVLGRQFTPMTGTLTSPAALKVGGHNFSSAFFKGQLDELTLYDRALTFSEVRLVFLAGSQGKQ